MQIDNEYPDLSPRSRKVMKQPTDYEMIKPSGEGVRSSVDTKAEHWFNGLPTVQSMKECSHCRRPMSHVTAPVHFRGDCVPSGCSKHQASGGECPDGVSESGEPVLETWFAGLKTSGTNEWRTHCDKCKGFIAADTFTTDLLEQWKICHFRGDCVQKREAVEPKGRLEHEDDLSKIYQKFRLTMCGLEEFIEKHEQGPWMTDNELKRLDKSVVCMKVAFKLIKMVLRKRGISGLKEESDNYVLKLLRKAEPAAEPTASEPETMGKCSKCGAAFNAVADHYCSFEEHPFQPEASRTTSEPTKVELANGVPVVELPPLPEGSHWDVKAWGGTGERVGEISVKYPEASRTGFHGCCISAPHEGACKPAHVTNPAYDYRASRTAGEVDAKPVLDGMMPKVLARTIRDYYGHDGGSVQAANPDPCEKCDSEHSQGPHITICPESPASLQLLVIDMGDSCVLKAEKGTVSFQVPFHGGREFEAVRLDTEWRAQLVTRPFADVRAAIDALEGENNRPVPRIEREIDFEGDEMCYIFAEKDRDAVTAYIYDALSELAGKPLPVYKPKVGKWVKLQDAIDIVPIEVWRFTLEGKST